MDRYRCGLMRGQLCGWCTLTSSSVPRTPYPRYSVYLLYYSSTKVQILTGEEVLLGVHDWISQAIVALLQQQGRVKGVYSLRSHALEAYIYIYIYMNIHICIDIDI